MNYKIGKHSHAICFSNISDYAISVFAVVRKRISASFSFAYDYADSTCFHQNRRQHFHLTFLILLLFLGLSPAINAGPGDAMPGLFAVNANGVQEKNDLSLSTPWVEIPNTSTGTSGIVAMAGYHGTLYAVFNNTLYRWDSSTTAWNVIDTANNGIVAMTVHHGQIYIVSNHRLLVHGAFSSQNNWLDVGPAISITALASYNGRLYGATNTQLVVQDSASPNGWKTVGEAYGVNSLTSYQGNLYALSNNKIWKRGAIGPGAGNDWAYAGDAMGLTSLASVPLDCHDLPNPTPPATIPNCPKGRVLSIVAHEDDDLYFINPVIRKAMTNGQCTRTVYIAYASDYRIFGAQYAHAVMSGADMAATWTQSNLNCGGPNGPNLELYTLNNNTSLAFRLMDPQNPDHATNFLKAYVNGSNLSDFSDAMTKLDNAYLIDTLTAVINDYSPTEIHTLNPDPTDYIEHPWHIGVARAVRNAAAQSLSNPIIYYHETYSTASKLANISPGLLRDKEDALVAFFAGETLHSYPERKEYTYDPYYTTQEQRNYFRFAPAHTPPATPPLEPVKLYNLMTGTCIDSGDGSASNLTMKKCQNIPSQLFTFTPDADKIGQAIITSAGKCLEWAANNTVIQSACAQNNIYQHYWTKADPGRIMYGPITSSYNTYGSGPPSNPLPVNVDPSTQGTCLTISATNTLTADFCKHDVSQHWALNDTSRFGDVRQDVQVMADFTVDGRSDVLLAGRPHEPYYCFDRYNPLFSDKSCPRFINNLTLIYVSPGVQFNVMASQSNNQLGDPTQWAEEAGLDYYLADQLPPHDALEHEQIRMVAGDFDGIVDNNKPHPDLLVLERNYSNGGVNLQLYGNIPDGANNRKFNRSSSPLQTLSGIRYDESRFAAGDFNNDRLDDLLIMKKRRTNGSFDLFLLLSPISLNSKPILLYSGSDSSMLFDNVRLLAGDLTGDHRADVVVINKSATGIGQVLAFIARTYKGSIQLRSPYSKLLNGISYNDIRADLGDINRDGKKDVVLFHKHPDDGGFSIKTMASQLTSSTFSFAPIAIAGDIQPTIDNRIYFTQSFPTLGDTDGDGDADLVISYSAIDNPYSNAFYAWSAGKTNLAVIPNVGSAFSLPDVVTTLTDMEFDWLWWFSTVPSTDGSGKPYVQ